MKIVTAFLCSAVSLKISNFRELLEEGGYRLCDRRSLSDLVPFIQKREHEHVRKELSVIFDGTTCLGEALCLVVRYISVEWTIENSV